MRGSNMKTAAIWIAMACAVLFTGQVHAQDATKVVSVGDLSNVRTIKIERGLTEQGQKCVACHADHTPGIVADWKSSRHSHVGVSCLDCHQVDANSPMAVGHDVVMDKDKYSASDVDADVFVSVLVPPSVCGRCHAQEQDEFNKSGHFRGYRQIIPKDSLHALVEVHEGRGHEEFGTASGETGCMQCHGSEIKLDDNNRPTPETWPNYGIGNVYPNGSTGNCGACHTRHKFSIAEARQPAACASCHLGPDHPDIEIYENSKHGQIYATEGHTWNWDAPPDAWEPGDYRAPTCATCHMSGIGELSTTHNISERLFWNLWAKESKVRMSPDPMSPLTGNGPMGRLKMKQVCSSCHSSLHTDGFFKQGDKAVNLYNAAYWAPAKEMHDELAEKGLLRENPWTDRFQIVFYYLWHHEGRRARQGAMMGAPDYAHWHGFFELQQDMYELEAIHKKRIETGTIEEL